MLPDQDHRPIRFALSSGRGGRSQRVGQRQAKCSQRADLELRTSNDGVHAYGPGVWPFHDHQYQGVTTDGIGPGGNVSAIVYAEHQGEDGWPKTLGVSYDPYFTEAYYRKEVPIWESYAPGLFNEPGVDWWLLLRLVALALITGILGALVLTSARR